MGSETDSQSPLRRLTTIVVLAACVGAAACVAVVLLGRLAVMPTTAETRPQIQSALAAGVLPRADRPQPHGPAGPHPFNECLIYLMATQHSGNAWHDAVAPLALEPIVNSRDQPGIRPCPTLAAWADTGEPGVPLIGYGRYLQGHRLIAALALAAGLVMWMPSILSVLVYAILVAGLVRNAAALLRAGTDRLDRARHAALLAAGLSFLVYDGLPAFSRALSHAPADMGLFALLLLASGRDLVGRPLQQRVLIAAGFGAWAAVFEFLTGPIPMLMSLLLLLHGVAGPLPWRDLLGRAATSVAAAGTAIVVAFASKQMALLLVGDDLVQQSAGALARWTSPNKGDLWAHDGFLQARMMVFRSIYWFVPTLEGVSTLAAQAMLGLAIVQVVVCGGFLVATRRLAPVRLALLLGPLAVVGGWYVALPGHTTLHVNFMVRLVVWLPLTGWVLSVLAVVLRPGGAYSAGAGPATILTRLARESRSSAR
jgi:hypothetical protein